MFPRERDHTCDSHTTKDKSTQNRGNHRPKSAFLTSIFISVALHESLARQTVGVTPSNGMSKMSLDIDYIQAAEFLPDNSTPRVVVPHHSQDQAVATGPPGVAAIVFGQFFQPIRRSRLR
jgi:hypothetical protein